MRNSFYDIILLYNGFKNFIEINGDNIILESCYFICRNILVIKISYCVFFFSRGFFIFF